MVAMAVNQVWHPAGEGGGHSRPVLWRGGPVVAIMACGSCHTWPGVLVCCVGVCQFFPTTIQWLCGDSVRWQQYCGGPWTEEGRVIQSGDKRVCCESLSVGGRCEHESVVISLEVGGEQLSRRHQLKRPVGETSFGAELQKGYNSK